MPSSFSLPLIWRVKRLHAKTNEKRVFKFCLDSERLRGLRREVALFRVLKEELGDRDDIVPYPLGQQLFEAAPEPKVFETIAGAGHNDTTLVGGPPYFARIGRFLNEVAPR